MQWIPPASQPSTHPGQDVKKSASHSQRERQPPLKSTFKPVSKTQRVKGTREFHKIFRNCKNINRVLSPVIVWEHLTKTWQRQRQSRSRKLSVCNNLCIHPHLETCIVFSRTTPSPSPNCLCPAGPTSWSVTLRLKRTNSNILPLCKVMLPGSLPLF